MKAGDRVCATIPLHRTGVPVNVGDCGTVVAVQKGRSYSRKTGFGRERSRTSDRVQVHWDRGPVGWHYAEVLAKEGAMQENARKRKPKKYEGLAIVYSPMNQRWLVLWPGGRVPIERQQVLGRFETLDEAERYADSITSKTQDNPRRPPKKWMRDCIRGASHRARSTGKRARDPAAVCGALWYKKMTEAERRAAVRREHRLEDNPTGFWGKFLG